MEFSQHFRGVHAQLGSAFSVEQFADLIEPQAIGLGTKQEFYAPVRFTVQVSSGSNGAIRLDVPVHANPEWYTQLRSRLAGMLGAESLESALELRTVTGKPIQEVEPGQLASAGKLNIFVGGDLKRFPSLPAKVPTEYSVTKVSELHEWVSKVAKELPEAVADELYRKDVAQVDAAIRRDGSMQRLIEERLKGSLDWPEFTRVYHANSPAKADAAHAQAVLRKISANIRDHIRSHIGASKSRIDQYIGSMQAKPLADESDHALAPVLGKHDSPLNVTEEDGHAMYCKLVEDALSNPVLQRDMISAVHNTPLKAAPQAAVVVVRSDVPKLSIGAHHPWFAQIHHTILPLRGAYPSDYIARHTRQDMSAKAPYSGDVGETYRAYHLLSGQHAVPPGLVVEAGRAELVECGDRKKTSKKNKKNAAPPADSKAPIRSAFPCLVPLSELYALEDVGHGLGGEKEKREWDEQIKASSPRGRSRSGSPRRRGSMSSDESDGENPYYKKGNPLGAPIAAAETVEARMRARLAPIGKPHLVPIKRDAEEVAALQDDFSDDFAHLPTVDDIFK